MKDAPSELARRMLHLRGVPVAAVLSTPVLRSVAAHLVERRFRVGEPLMVHGEPIDALYFLTRGVATLRRGDVSLGELAAPQTLGFLGILARTEGTYDAVAATETVAWELQTDTLLELLEDHFELLEATVRYLAERVHFDVQELPAEALGMPPVELGPVPPRLELVDRILLLRKFATFAQVDVQALAAMAREIEEARLPAGSVLWRVGERADRALFLVGGGVRCETADGRVFRYGPGTGVGGIEALADRPRWTTVTAESDIVGFYGRTDRLLDLFEHHFRMGMDFVMNLARAELGLLERRAKLGHAPLAALRDVSRLGAVRVGG